ncbi:MAG: DNA translocase FtsK, partial [Clostridia bacterium]|nr:DNA translocase FtsK [Clostridia bacterium]
KPTEQRRSYHSEPVRRDFRMEEEQGFQPQFITHNDVPDVQEPPVVQEPRRTEYSWQTQPVPEQASPEQVPPEPASPEWVAPEQESPVQSSPEPVTPAPAWNEPVRTEPAIPERVQSAPVAAPAAQPPRRPEQRTAQGEAGQDMAFGIGGAGSWREQLAQRQAAIRQQNEEAQSAAQPARQVPAQPVTQAPAPQQPVRQTRPADLPPWEEAPAVRPVFTEQAMPAEPVKPDNQVKPVLQKPKDSWYEGHVVLDAADAVKGPVNISQPARVQMTTPAEAYQPDLKLPPRREPAPFEEEEDTPVELPYIPPSYDLLDDPKPANPAREQQDEYLSRMLEDTLQSFKVPAKVMHITHGPAITRFELEIAQGIRVNKVLDLEKNIAMAMRATSIRIEAPIPGKSLVGIEIPNANVAVVKVKEVLQDRSMQVEGKPLLVALGKDIAGNCVSCDLSKMPHLLIAGSTGSGKSVCINTIINSILFRSSPKDVRMIMVDPKVVELQCYNGIPHLLLPVISDPHKAAGALEWAVAEMMERYNKFTVKGVREINGYNNNLNDGEEYMSRIVIIIDELADLMMTCKKDVEERICRLAQLARAAGIHLIVATQRPSVDVVTGLIKANIPSRIAFKVTQFVDSRTILDRGGAEALLGRGDMLYMPTGQFAPLRVQGCFMDDNEVNRVVDEVKRNNPAEYNESITEALSNISSDMPAMPGSDSAPDSAGGDKDLLRQAVELTVMDGQVSTSLLQRRLRLGYSRAGRIVDEMEKLGIVSAKDGSKPRLCLISREQYELMKDELFPD